MLFGPLRTSFGFASLSPSLLHSLAHSFLEKNIFKALSTRSAVSLYFHTETNHTQSLGSTSSASCGRERPASHSGQMR